jgi:hypothetical protein
MICTWDKVRTQTRKQAWRVLSAQVPPLIQGVAYQEFLRQIGDIYLREQSAFPITPFVMSQINILEQLDEDME